MVAYSLQPSGLCMACAVVQEPRLGMGAPACKRHMCQRLKYVAPLQLVLSLPLGKNVSRMSPRKACADPRSRGLRPLDHYMSSADTRSRHYLRSIQTVSARTWRVGFLSLVRCGGSSLDLFQWPWLSESGESVRCSWALSGGSCRNGDEWRVDLRRTPTGPGDSFRFHLTGAPGARSC